MSGQQRLIQIWCIIVYHYNTILIVDQYLDGNGNRMEKKRLCRQPWKQKSLDSQSQDFSFTVADNSGLVSPKQLKIPMPSILRL